LHNILHIISDTNIGGAGVHLLTFLAHFDRERLAVSVLCPPGSRLLERCRGLGVATYTSSYLAGDRSFGWSGVRGLCRDLSAIVKEKQIRLVHTHASFSGRLAAKILGVPRIVYTKHRQDWNTNPSWLKKRVLASLNRRTCHQAIAVSQAVKEDLIESGLPKDKIAMIYNGVDVEELRKQARQGATDLLAPLGDSQVVGMVARLAPEKGHEFFLQGAAIVLSQQPDTFFLIVGDGELGTVLQERADELGITERVIFTGYQENIAPLINRMDVLVVPSLTEAFGITLIEGMCLSKPCVASDVGGLAEIAEIAAMAGNGGMVVNLAPPGDGAAIGAKMLYLLENPGIARHMGQQGAKVAETLFSARKMTAEITALYDRILS